MSSDARQESNAINKALVEVISKIPYDLNLFTLMQNELNNIQEHDLLINEPSGIYILEIQTLSGLNERFKILKF